MFLRCIGGQLALRRRPSRGLLAGLWEYPNEIAPAPCPVFGWERDHIAAKHIFTHVEWHMHGRTLFPLDAALPEGWVWAGPAELEQRYALPSAFAPFTKAVEDGLRFTGAKIERTEEFW